MWPSLTSHLCGYSKNLVFARRVFCERAFLRMANFTMKWSFLSSKAILDEYPGNQSLDRAAQVEHDVIRCRRTTEYQVVNGSIGGVIWLITSLVKRPKPYYRK